MARIPDDPTIHVGLRLYDGTDYDTIVERVEYGGFGVIAFGPNRLGDGQIVAYKTLRRELLKDPQIHAGFVRECLLWVGLWGHVNVAIAHTAFKMGDAIGQRPFLALQYADQGSLRELLRGARRLPGGRLPLDIGLNFAQQIAAGLAYLHRPDPAYLRTEPTVHRDLKPENVLLRSDGRAVITDFGLAKAVKESPIALALLLSQRGNSQPGPSGRQAEEAILLDGAEVVRTTGLHTAAGAALGTIPYMPPEQWEDARNAGTPADIYALGIMLSEILAGRHALLDLEQPHSQAEWQRAHQVSQPRPLRDVAPDVPGVVENIYRRCLAHNPDDRPTADEVFAALQNGARAATLPEYVPYELIPHTQYNEWVHWHMWSIAYLSFDDAQEGLTRSDKALAIARQISADRPTALPTTLLTRGNILELLGTQALAAGRDAEAAALDRQTEAAYQESLATYARVPGKDGHLGPAWVWSQIGIFNRKRHRYAHAEDAYARSLKIDPNASDTYFNRALNQREWAFTDYQMGHADSAIAHMRQARVFTVTSMAMGDPTAPALLKDIEALLERMGVQDHA